MSRLGLWPTVGKSTVRIKCSNFCLDVLSSRSASAPLSVSNLTSCRLNLFTCVGVQPMETAIDGKTERGKDRTKSVRARVVNDHARLEPPTTRRDLYRPRTSP